jgi:radical SAM superfamily enzyme YgiQ (UPF0313 family)
MISTTTSQKALNITLIRPPMQELRSNLSPYGAIPPIGLAYIAAALRDVGHHLNVIDAVGESIDEYSEFKSPVGVIHSQGLSPERIVARIPEDTDLIGVTHMFLHEWPTIKQIVEKAKVKVPNALIVIGGENSTAFWKSIFEETRAVDYCILGEGENTIVNFTRRMVSGESLEELLGVACRNREIKELSKALPARILDLNQLSQPAWDLFPMESYMKTADHHGVHRGRSIPMITTRGCPYQCTFCSNSDMWTTRYITREPQDVVNEMKRYQKQYEVNNINFCDLTAIIQKKWIMEFCSILKKENLEMTWQLPTGTRSEALYGEVLTNVYETGCRNITYAPESGSERMLKVIKKKIKIPRMLKSLKEAKKAGLVTRVNIIIGHPQEERSDTRKSLWLLVKCALVGCHDAAVMIFAPYPGSVDTQNLIDQGKVSVGKDYYYLALARSGWSSRTYNHVMGTKELLIKQYFMLCVFYAVAYITHPWQILDVFRSLFTGNEQTLLDQLLRTKLHRVRFIGKAPP